MQFIDLSAQYEHLKEKIDRRIQTVLDHGKYIMGPEVRELEARLSDFTGAEHVITCANGTDALQLALMALDVKKGDAVFCPTFTFFASAEVIAQAGATPIFVDSDEQTFNICPNDLRRRVQSVVEANELTPKAIIAVDLFGLPADYPEIIKIATEYNLKVIEDAAQGFGGKIDGKRACTFGDIATTSFFPAKPLGCYGDGGAVFTNNTEYAEIIRSLRVHGQGKDKYDNVRIGMNSRLDTIQAAVLLEKLNAFPDEMVKRKVLANAYHNLLPSYIALPVVPDGFESAWAQYTVQTANREEFMAKLHKLGIPTMVYYRTCMHQQTAFKAHKPESFPVAERLSSQVLSLPMHPYMDIDVLVKAFSEL